MFSQDEPRVVTLKIRAVGEIHYDVALSLMNVALALFDLGRFDEAVENNQRALGILERTVGPQHPNVATCLSNGAEFANARNLYGQAQSMAGRALGIWESELHSEHPFLAYALTATGWSMVGLGKSAQAIPFLERALAIREKGDPEPDRLGETRFALARALWEAKGRTKALAFWLRRPLPILKKSPGTLKRKKLSVELLDSIPARRNFFPAPEHAITDKKVNLRLLSLRHQA